MAVSGQWRRWATSSGALADWQWLGALARARPGARYRLTSLPFSVARHRCVELGCSEGEIVTCRENGHGIVRIQRDDGRELALERKLAWFVRVEALQ